MTRVDPCADRPQRERALDPRRSIIVQAPAGSGKTELLTQRYLRLLAFVPQPEAIVALTFTRKAAGEMQDRILTALRRAAGGIVPEAAHERVTHELAIEALGQDRARGWNLLENPARMRVQTIDSLCASLTRQMPWLARLGAQPEIADDPRPHYSEAARRTLLEVERAGKWQQALETLLLHLDNNAARVQALLVAMLAIRDQWLHLAVQCDEEGQRAELERAMANAIVDGLRRADALIPAEARPTIAGLARYAASNTDDPREPLHACAGLAEMPECAPERLPEWLGLAALLLTKDGTWRSRLTKDCGFPAPGNAGNAADKRTFAARKEQGADLITRLAAAEGLEGALAFVRVLPPARYTGEQWKVMRALFAVLKLAAANLRMVFREEGAADFCEIAQAARAALGDESNTTDLALAMDARVEHLLVDEFQDTSVGQYELLSRLTAGWEPGDGRTLFLVGDPMQSVYRFRQAEVGLFLSVQQSGLGAVRPEPVGLLVNHRSEAGVVEWVNRVFAAVFPERCDISTGAIRYSEAVPANPGGPRAVSVYAFRKGEDEREAETVAELIRQAQGCSVAVLVRARTHLPAIVGALKRAGARFRAIDIDSLGERPVVRDLLALTRAMLHLADRPAWLAILRAPWCGLTLADLDALVAGDFVAPVWELLDRSLARLSPGGQARAARLREVLGEAFAERGRWPLRRWVERVWSKLGGPACLDGESALQDAADFLDLLEQEQQGADLADLDGFRTRVAELFAQPDSSADGSLQLLTIHKAKGLQFDSVIVPGLGRRPKHDEARLMLFAERPREDGAIDRLLAPIKETGADFDPVYRYLSALEAEKNRNECLRLLYVAATRARRELHLLGHAEPDQDGNPRPDAGSLLSLLWPGLSEPERGVFEECVSRPAPEETEAPAIAGVPLRRLPEDWTMPALPAPAAWGSGEPREVEVRTPTFEWVGDLLRHAGTVVHAMLQRIGKGAAPLDAAAIERMRPVYRMALGNLGVGPEDVEEGAARVEQALLKTAASERGRWILGAHENARCEYAVAGAIEGEIVSGTIDRTFIDAVGVRWIIDYKTSAHEGGNVEEFLEEQQRRYRGQLERYARLLAPLGRPIRLGLYFPLLDGWREWPPEGGVR